MPREGKEEIKGNPFKSGDWVKYKDDLYTKYQVYLVYSRNYVSLGLTDYPDTEQDYLTHISKIQKA